MADANTDRLLGEIVSELKGIRAALEGLKRTPEDDKMFLSAAEMIERAIREAAGQ